MYGVFDHSDDLVARLQAELARLKKENQKL